jgi:hypothetical protein
MNQEIEQLVEETAEILDRDPLDQMQSTEATLRVLVRLVALELAEHLVTSAYNQGTRMYFDEKIAAYEIKKAVGLL